MPPSARAIAVAESVVVALLLGSTLVIAKGALNDVGPLTLAALLRRLAALPAVPHAPEQRGALVEASLAAYS